MIEITTRPMSRTERATLERQTRVRTIALAGILLLVFMLGGGFFVALCYSIGQQLGPLEAKIGGGIGLLVASVLSVTAMLAYRTSERQRSERALKDLQHNLVEEILVIDADSVEIGMAAMDEPALVFRVTDIELLLLQGGWLLMSETYESDPDRIPEETAPDIFNGLQAPYSFPSSEFSVIRFPLSGQVVRIQVGGEYRAPRIENVKYAEKHCAALRESEILSGTLETLEQSLAAAYDVAGNNS